MLRFNDGNRLQEGKVLSVIILEIYINLGSRLFSNSIVLCSPDSSLATSEGSLSLMLLSSVFGPINLVSDRGCAVAKYSGPRRWGLVMCLLQQVTLWDRGPLE